MVYDGIWYAFLHLHLNLHSLGSMFICNVIKKKKKKKGLGLACYFTVNLW